MFLTMASRSIACATARRTRTSLSSGEGVPSWLFICMNTMRMVLPLKTCRFGSVCSFSAWSLGTCMMKSSPPEITSAIWVWRSGMKRMTTLPIFGWARGESLK